MPPRCYPPDPPLNRGEAKVWKALYNGLRDCDVLMSSVRFDTPKGDVEVDLVVLTPDLGFAAIEVKGGTVYLDDGQWMQKGPQGDHEIEPLNQAVSGKHSLARYLERHPQWSRGRVRMAHVIALPETPLPPDFRAPGIENSLIVLDATEIDHAAQEVYKRLQMHLPNQPAAGPGEYAVDLAVKLLAPSTDPVDRIAAAREYREAYVEALTEERAALLKALRLVKRYEVSGGPGTGKTWMAMELAKTLALQGKRVAFLCYSKGLATYVQREIKTWRRKERPAVVSTFHGLGDMWELAGDTSLPNYWEEVLPDRIGAHAEQIESGLKYDAVVVDEAQDFGPRYWTAVLNMLRGEPGLFIFRDAEQRVFNRDGMPLVDLVPIVLDQNIRNSRQIGQAVNSLTSEKMRLLGGEGPEVRWIDVPTSEAVRVADDQIDPLLAEGWEPQDIALLTTQNRHPVHTERANAGKENYWDTLFDDADIFYSTVSGFKGLERPVVVLAIDGFHDGVVPREVLYVGMSRARDLLIVCGPRGVLRGVEVLPAT
jgi:hypothetical protein